MRIPEFSNTRKPSESPPWRTGRASVAVRARRRSATRLQDAGSNGADPRRDRYFSLSPRTTPRALRLLDGTRSGLEVSLGNLFQHRVVEREVGDDPLESPVLDYVKKVLTRYVVPVCGSTQSTMPFAHRPGRWALQWTLSHTIRTTWSPQWLRSPEIFERRSFLQQVDELTHGIAGLLKNCREHPSGEFGE